MMKNATLQWSLEHFGGALNLNVHFHMLSLDGVYVDQPGAY
ncbi:MAG: hypothetical protein AB8B63_24385 [Granulosicoccus sp.]